MDGKIKIKLYGIEDYTNENSSDNSIFHGVYVQDTGRELLIVKKLNNFVFQGIFEHLAKFFLCTNIFINEDFHTFERQKNANSGKFKTGHCFISATLFTNSAEIIFIQKLYSIKQQ